MKAICEKCKFVIKEWIEGDMGSYPSHKCRKNECPDKYLKIDPVTGELHLDEQIKYDYWEVREHSESSGFFKRLFDIPTVIHFYAKCDKINKDGNCKDFQATK